jgi:hypothetical protein
MTLLLIKRLVWGHGKDKDVLNIVDEEDVTIEDEKTESDVNTGLVTEEEKAEDREKDEDEEEEEEEEEEDDEKEDTDDEEEEDSDDDIYQPDCSTFQFDFYKDIQIIVARPEFKQLYHLYTLLVMLSFSVAVYNSSSSYDYLTEVALTPNLPFCEKPFAITPYMAQGASAIAHLPYVPALFLGISYASPEMCDTLNPATNKYAIENRLFLWVQFTLQLFTSFSGHVIPNPRFMLSQEISIALAFILLYNFFNLTTPQQSKKYLDAQAVSMVIAISIGGFLAVGLMPIIFIGFAASLLLEMVIPNSFGLLTPDARLALLYPFCACVVTLLVENIGCDWLLDNISPNYPWHVTFDILFWQVLGSSVDVVLLSPRPGRFITSD